MQPLAGELFVGAFCLGLIRIVSSERICLNKTIKTDTRFDRVYTVWTIVYNEVCGRVCVCLYMLRQKAPDRIFCASWCFLLFLFRYFSVVVMVPPGRSLKTRALIANPPNSAQLEGTSYHSPNLHPRLCSTVGMRRATDKQTHRRPWQIYISPRLRLMRNVTIMRSLSITARGHGCSVHITRVHGPCRRVVCTGTREHR